MKIEGNRVSVEVSDIVNHGNNGQLKLYIGNKKIAEKEIVMDMDYQTESFTINPDQHGFTYRIVAASGNQKAEVRQVKSS